MAKNIFLDQFFTTQHEVDKCMLAIASVGIDLHSFDVVLEPSAGAGAFYNYLPSTTRVGLDLDPKCEGVIKMDFFDYIPNNIFDLQRKNIITVGNPPYGRAGNLAVKFINRAAEYSDFICMVLPRSFNKYSIQNRLNKHLNLIHSHLVDDFVLPDGTTVKVRSVFQIWEKKQHQREKVSKRKTTQLFDAENPAWGRH